MATSLINVQTQGSQRGVNVLAQDTSTGTALENAIAAGVTALGGTFQAAAELGGGPIGLVIPSAVPPATDGTPKALYRVDFRPGSGPNGANPASLFVLAWPQTTGSTTTPAPTLAAQAAASAASAVPSQVVLLAQVDVDTTTSTASAPADLTKFAFRSLFTFTELVGIDNYQTSTTLTDDQKAAITTILANFQAAEDINLGDPATIQGVEYLASVGLLTTARAAQILLNQPYLTVTAPTITATNGMAIAPINAVATGGSGTGYVFSATLPPGLTISPLGQITGTPTTAGSYSYTVKVTDSVGDTAAATGSITVN